MSIDILPSPPDLPAPDAAPLRPSPLRLVISGAVLLLVLALIGGVTLAVRGLSGGGSQPEDALPGGAFAFGKVDLDPPAGQKINALRFLRTFPALRDKISLDGDLRESLFEGVADSAGWDELEFDADVAPWLGQRIGIAAYAPGAEDGAASGSGYEFGTPATIVVALQVTDGELARAGLARLNAATDGASVPGVVVQEGYALLAADQDTADQAARDAQDGALSDDADFSSDLAALGDGVASAWVDMDGVTSLARLTGFTGMGAFGLAGLDPGAAGRGGRTSYVLRFDGADALEVRGAVTGAAPLAGADQPLRGFTDLPEDSVVAFGLAGGERLVPPMFEALRAALDDQGAKTNGHSAGFDEMVADAERELGIELPEDLAVLLGSNLVAALHEGSLRDGEVELGARVTTDGPRAVSVLDSLQQATRDRGADLPVIHRLTDDGVIVASSQAQVDRLGAPGGLGDRDVVRKALPDIDGASMALWVDIRSLASEFGGNDTLDENLGPLEGLGLTVRVQDGGATSYRLRIVVR